MLVCKIWKFRKLFFLLFSLVAFARWIKTTYVWHINVEQDIEQGVADVGLAGVSRLFSTAAVVQLSRWPFDLAKGEVPMQ